MVENQTKNHNLKGITWPGMGKNYTCMGLFRSYAYLLFQIAREEARLKELNDIKELQDQDEDAFKVKIATNKPTNLNFFK